MSGTWLSWAPLAAAGLHMTEEFVYPGGFKAWSDRARTGIRKSVTGGYLVVINGLLLVLCYDVGALSGRQSGVDLWLAVAALMFANAIWHLVWTYRTRSYSPGLATGLLVYIPLAAYGSVWFIRSGQSSALRASLPLAAGASFQYWANLLHRYRASRAPGAGNRRMEG